MNNNDLVTFFLPKNQICSKMGLQKYVLIMDGSEA